MPKKFVNVKLSETAFAKLNFLAKACNTKKSRFLEELLGEVFEIASQYQNGLNILYSGSFNSGWLKLNFLGRSNVSVGIRRVEKVGEDKNAIVRVLKVKGASKNEK